MLEEVLVLKNEGYTSLEIAQALAISLSTANELYMKFYIPEELKCTKKVMRKEKNPGLWRYGKRRPPKVETKQEIYTHLESLGL